MRADQRLGAHIKGLIRASSCPKHLTHLWCEGAKDTAITNRRFVCCRAPSGQEGARTT